MLVQNDWRRQGQESYLKKVTLSWKSYTNDCEEWDHDHCEFCNAKFMKASNKDVLNEGYVTEDAYRWICKECFEDFRDEYQWFITNHVV